MEGADTGTLGTLADLFFRLGPFFLALFLPLVILTKARSWYNEAVVRQNPPATEEERETYRYYFLGSVGASAAVFALSLLAWWLLNMTRDHIYQVAILDLPQNVNLDSRYFYRDSLRPTAVGGITRDRYFLIEQPVPFTSRQKFQFDYYAQPAGAPASGVTPIQLAIEYNGKNSETFHVALQNGHPALVADDSNGANTAGLMPAPVTRLADIHAPRPVSGDARTVR